MLNDLKAKIQDLDIDFQKYFAWFKPQKISGKTLSLFRSHLRSIPPEEVKELKAWLLNVHNIQTDSILTKKEKSDLIKELPTSDVIVEFLKSSTLAIAEDGPIKDRVLLRRIIDGASIFTAGTNLRVAGALFALKAAIPYMLRTDAGTRLITFLKNELDKIENPTAAIE